MNIFKFKKNSAPAISSLRPLIFNQTKHWSLILVLFFLILFVTAIVGFNLFRSVYTESYKKDIPLISGEELINAKRLKSAVDKRKEFLNQPVSLPKDPSM